jgi:DMSO/TMAO reductase YedYZ heme-binding membrane subunit
MATIYLWIWSLFISLLIFALFFLYSLGLGVTPSWRMLNTVSANTGITVIILSLAIGTLSYFFPSVTRFIKYRKEIGIIGFLIVLFHIFVTLFYLRERFPFPASYLHGKSLLSFSAALVSTCILTMMTLISNSLAIKFFGKWWRRLLRVGYLAALLALLHMSLRETRSWSAYLQNIMEPPPLSILLLWFGVWVILLRISVYFLTRNKKTETG